MSKVTFKLLVFLLEEIHRSFKNARLYPLRPHPAAQQTDASEVTYLYTFLSKHTYKR